MNQFNGRNGNGYLNQYVMEVEKVENRKGIFSITLDLIESDPSAVMAVMANVIIYRAELVGFGTRIEYNATSPLFDSVAFCDEVPTYIMLMCEDGTVKAEKND